MKFLLTLGSYEVVQKSAHFTITFYHIQTPFKQEMYPIQIPW